jgi:polyphosphate glucokinase
MQVLGIDVGGTGIKGNIVDIKTGQLISEKLKIKTPSPASPNAILGCIKEMVEHYDWRGKNIGIGFPAVIKNGYSLTASNIDKKFINYPIVESFKSALQCEVTVVNDADAAGIAEMTYGEGKGKKGLVIFITLGTGIGSALFLDGRLIGNTEFGHLKYKRSIFEKYASNSAREIKNLSWRAWSDELNVYLNHLNLLLSPDMIIIGGGISKNFDIYGPLLDVPTTVVPASMMNDAGIVGAAMAAAVKK